MFKPGMMSTRVHQVREAELTDIPKSLNLWRVEEGEEVRINLYVPVNRVFDGFYTNLPPVFLLVLRLAVLCFFRVRYHGMSLLP